MSSQPYSVEAIETAAGQRWVLTLLGIKLNSDAYTFSDPAEAWARAFEMNALLVA